MQEVMNSAITNNKVLPWIQKALGIQESGFRTNEDPKTTKETWSKVNTISCNRGSYTREVSIDSQSSEKDCNIT